MQMISVEGLQNTYIQNLIKIQFFASGFLKNCIRLKVSMKREQKLSGSNFH